MTFNASMFFILLFVSIFFISQALILPAAGQRAKHRELAKRLQKTKSNIDTESVNLLKEHYRKSLSPLDRRLVSISYFANLKKVLELAGINIGLGDLFARTLLACLLLAIVGLLILAPWYFSLVGSVFIVMSVAFYVNWKVTQRLTKFEEQLPEALDIIRRMLQAGQPLSQAFKEVGEELPAPAGEEFANTFNLLNFGYDTKVAMLNMADRVPTISMLAFSSAVMLQKETGGNLSENLHNVSEVLRARFKLARKIKTLTAESRMSAWVLVLAPFFLFAAMYFINRPYLEPLYTDPRGLKAIAAGMISMVIGAFWIRKVVNVEV